MISFHSWGYTASCLYESHVVQDRILKTNSWKLSSWEGSSTCDTENSFQMTDALTKTQGMYSTTWMLRCRVGKSRELSSPVSHLTVTDTRWLGRSVQTVQASGDNLLNSTDLWLKSLFLSKVQRCSRKHWFLLYLYLSCFLNLPLWTFTVYIIWQEIPQILTMHWERKCVLLLSTCYWLMPMYFQDWTVIICFPFLPFMVSKISVVFPSYPSQGL